MIKKNKLGEELKAPDLDVMEYNLRRVLNSPGLQIPPSYLVLDLETTGVDPSVGSIWQIGMYPVLNGEPTCDPINGETIYLKLPEEELRKNKFEIGRRRAKILGKPHNPREAIDYLTDEVYHIAEAEYVDEVQTKGVDPKTGLMVFTDIVQSYVDSKLPLVGQNFVKFDVPFIEYNCVRYGIDFKFPSERMIDTGMLIKAAILKRRIMGNETSRSFGVRLGEEWAKGVFHALERFCIPYWDMEAKYGIDLESAHDAGYDCYITALVLREMIAEVINRPNEVEDGT